MLNKLFRPLHEHADPSQRVLGVQALPPEAPELAQLLQTDPAPEVRAAAATRGIDLAALIAAAARETDASVTVAVASALAKVLAESSDGNAAGAFLSGDACSDAIRADVAQHAPDAERRAQAIENIRDENVLVDVALAAAHAPIRMAAAERVQSLEPLRRLADAAQDRDRGVARLARGRVNAITKRISDEAEADAILQQADVLVTQAGPVVKAAIDLERRWKALDLAHDAGRRARWDAATQALQERFDREHAAQRARAQLEQRSSEWLGALRASPTTETLPDLRVELLALRELAQGIDDAATLAQLDQGEQQLAQWEQMQQALGSAEALVVEAEQLAAGTPIDDAQLPQRWQALDLAVRTPALTRRFEAALLVIEQRRLSYVRAAKEQEGASRQQLHTLLHTAEQALAAGQLHAAREAADAVKGLKPAAGTLPKPTLQRIGRLMQQLVELERWQSFGQHSARLQLCERAEELVRAKLEPGQIAQEVQKLRTEWKNLDKEHANVPKPLWERFDSACEKAYAPAAAHFAQLAAQRKQARKQREDFIAIATTHAQTLLNEPRDWRAIAHWLRDTEQAWHGNQLGSVDPGAWKKIDAQLRAALAPLREALGTVRGQAKSEREALVAQAAALAAKASERDAPAQVRALQAKWKEQATATPLAPRDERVLWEQFRAACDQVFSRRDSQRKEAEHRKQEHRRAFDVVIEQLEELGRATDKDEAEVRRQQRELQSKWKDAAAGGAPAPGGLEARFRNARGAVETMLGARKRAKEAEVWQALAAKERLCEELDALVLANPDAEKSAATAATVQQRWEGLPPLAGAWEKKLQGRRDAALRALNDEDARYDHLERIEEEAEARREALLELELLLGLETPAELRAQRMAVRVKRLNDRFRNTAGGGGEPEEHLLAWCERPGVADSRDRQRSERVIASLERRR